MTTKSPVLKQKKSATITYQWLFCSQRDTNSGPLVPNSSVEPPEPPPPPPLPLFVNDLILTEWNKKLKVKGIFSTQGFYSETMKSEILDIKAMNLFLGAKKVGSFFSFSFLLQRKFFVPTIFGVSDGWDVSSFLDLRSSQTSGGYSGRSSHFFFPQWHPWCCLKALFAVLNCELWIPVW